MTTLTVTEAKTHLLELVRKADKTMQRFVISKNGKPKAVLMSIDEYEGWLETLGIMSETDALKDINAAKKEIASGKYYTFDQVFKPSKKKKK